jgi:hypothetical protein
MMALAMAFMDGGYIDVIRNGKQLMYEKLAAEMAAPRELLRAHHYHCLPPNRMSQDESTFFSALGRISAVIAHHDSLPLQMPGSGA